MVKLNVKPLSVNQAYKGRKFKTDKLKSYTTLVKCSLPPYKMPKAPFKVYYVFGFSSKLSDIDNCIKNFQDILQVRYCFDDRDIYEMHVKKRIVPKGEEFIKFRIEHLEL